MPYILWVDDEDDVRRVTREVLESVGYEVVEAKTAEEAIERFKENPFRFDLVLTDIVLEGSKLDGEQLMQKIFELRDERGYDPAPHVICITGKPDRQNSPTIGRVEENGGRFVMKGHPNGFLPFLERELKRIEELRGQGPIFIIEHALSGYSGSAKVKSGDVCPSGEKVIRVLLRYTGGEEDLKLNDEDKLVFDYLARFVKRNPRSLDMITQGYYEHPFYGNWLSAGVNETKVKQSIYRIRRRMREAFAKVHLGLDPKDVLVTEKITSDEKEIGGQKKASRKSKNKKSSKDASKDNRNTQYRMKGRFIVRHIH
jgi:CheY-like chemotaxis protein